MGSPLVLSNSNTEVLEILMKRILAGGLVMVALAGTALAQQSLPPVQGEPCGVPMKTICVPECGVKEVRTPVYSKTCEPFCLPSCFHLHSLFGHCDSGCDGAQCEHPRTKYFLIKRYCVEKRPETKCIPVTVPACDAGPGCCAGGHPAVLGGPAEVIPPPGAKK
jgi:hypothetical protein